jgi:hypothetical protein
MIITSDDLQGIKKLKHFLSQDYFEITDYGPLSYFLGFASPHHSIATISPMLSIH